VLATLLRWFVLIVAVLAVAALVFLALSGLIDEDVP
jgi:hypothetical protein